MFVEQVIVLRDVFVVEIRDAEVEQDIQQERKIEEHEILSVSRIAHLNLHVRLNAEDPERLDEQVQAQQDNEVRNEFLLHGAVCGDAKIGKSVGRREPGSGCKFDLSRSAHSRIFFKEHAGHQVIQRE